MAEDENKTLGKCSNYEFADFSKHEQNFYLHK